MSTREVELTGGAPWGFRMHGGVDQNQPLRISRVNPGRKASLSGIREGDVITSINGKATKDMSNADAHAMLRSAGPALRLGLNEDREMSPRRRSIGKAAELKRPSQLISEISSGKATPQAPVYATIRPPHWSQNKLQSPTRSPNSPQSTFNSTSLVKSVISSEEPPKFHPTNPFYSTLPSNYNTSKLPIPNGKVTNSPLHSRSSNKIDLFSINNNENDLKLSSFFSRKFDSGPSSIPNVTCNETLPNSVHTLPKYFTNDKYNTFSNGQTEPTGFKIIDDVTNNDRNPFESIRINDFNQYKQTNDKLNGSSPKGEKPLLYSKSDGDFKSNEKVIKHSTITEKKISEVEEIKTIKKIVLNGSNESDHKHKNGILNSSEDLSKYNDKQNQSQSQDHVRKERLVPTTIENENYYKNEREQSAKQVHHRSPSSQIAREEYYAGEVPSVEVVTSRPPTKSPSSSHITTQANKRK